jgi:hypothetical protein
VTEVRVPTDERDSVRIEKPQAKTIAKARKTSAGSYLFNSKY